MKYRVIVDYFYDEKGEPIPTSYKEFDNAKEINDFIQNYTETTDFGIVGVHSISEDSIDLYLDVV